MSRRKVRADELVVGMTVKDKGTVLDASRVFHGHVLVLWLHPSLAEHQVARNEASDEFELLAEVSP
jgi:hypothetical protein